MLSLMGSGLAVLPGGQVPGAFFTGLGGVVGAVGSYVENTINDAEQKAAQRKGLEAAGITDPLMSTLLEGEPERMKELQEELGLNAQQIQQLALRYPDLVTHTEGEGLSLYNFKELKEDFRLNSQQSYELLLAIGNGTKDPQQTLTSFLISMKNFTADSPEQWKKNFEEQASLYPTGRNSYYSTAYRNALTYLNATPQGPGTDY
jgi:hypothetical protein